MISKRLSESEIINLLRAIEVERYKDLEKVNGRLRRIVSDLALDKSILKEALDLFRAQGLSPQRVRGTIIHVRQRLGSSERRTCQVL